MVALGSCLLLQLLFTHHSIFAPLQELRPNNLLAINVRVRLFFILLQNLGHVGGDKLGVPAVGEGTLSQLRGHKPLHQLGSSKQPEYAKKRLPAGASEVVEDEVAQPGDPCSTLDG